MTTQQLADLKGFQVLSAVDVADGLVSLSGEVVCLIVVQETHLEKKVSVYSYHLQGRGKHHLDMHRHTHTHLDPFTLQFSPLWLPPHTHIHRVHQPIPDKHPLEVNGQAPLWVSVGTENGVPQSRDVLASIGLYTVENKQTNKQTSERLKYIK